MHWLSNLRFGREVVLELLMATVDSDKVVCGGIHAMTVAVLVLAAMIYPVRRGPYKSVT
jgi:hypothetical protein